MVTKTRQNEANHIFVIAEKFTNFAVGYRGIKKNVLRKILLWIKLPLMMINRVRAPRYWNYAKQ